jgi:HEAT repeat protein
MVNARHATRLVDFGNRLGPESCTHAVRAALIACTLISASGCAREIDPQSARAEFSSKDRSMLRRAGDEGSPSLSPSAQTPVIATRSNIDHIEPSQPEPPLLPPMPPATADVASATPDASEILRKAVASNWPVLRAHAIEASAKSPALLREIAPRGLVDENRGVRFVACMAIGEAKNTELKRELSVLVRPLLTDESASVRAAAMLALTRCGVSVDVTPLARMLDDSDPEVRANAYLVLGELGNQSAAPLIRESLGRGMKLVNPIRARLVDLTAAEALVKLGDEREIEPIRAALFAPPEQSELTNIACEAIGRLRDEVSRPMLERLLSASGDARRPAEVRLSAARALVKLGGAEASGLAVAREYMGSPDARIRAQAAALLGEVRSPEAIALLGSLIRDGNPSVQVSAAAGLQTAE